MKRKFSQLFNLREKLFSKLDPRMISNDAKNVDEDMALVYRPLSQTLRWTVIIVYTVRISSQRTKWLYFCVTWWSNPQSVVLRSFRFLKNGCSVIHFRANNQSVREAFTFAVDARCTNTGYCIWPFLLAYSLVFRQLLDEALWYLDWSRSR